MLRGIALIVAAVVLGLVLLNATDGSVSVDTTASDRTDRTTDTESTPSTDSTTTTTAAAAKAHDPAQVSILVANGTGGEVAGLAGRIANTLKAANYVLKESTNTTSPAEASAVFYAAGYQADARKVADLLSTPPAIAPMPATLPVASLGGANLLVVAAADLAPSGT
jgi:hypothetical protein